MTLETAVSSQPGIRIRGLSHAAFAVGDRYAAARFYTTALNSEILD